MFYTSRWWPGAVIWTALYFSVRESRSHTLTHTRVSQSLLHVHVPRAWLSGSPLSVGGFMEKKIAKLIL